MANHTCAPDPSRIEALPHQTADGEATDGFRVQFDCTYGYACPNWFTVFVPIDHLALVDGQSLDAQGPREQQQQNKQDG